MSLRSFVTRWWAGEGGAAAAVLDAALLPAEWAFRGIVRARNRRFDRGIGVESVPVPVISVGNIGVGGAGKTPFSAWLVARLREWGRTPGIALRGYGGDEVILHRELNPGVRVATAARRVEAARELVAAGCDVVVLDDAFQHRRLARDLDVVLVAVETWERAPRLIPRGPWREDVTALARADVVVLTRKSAPAARAGEVAAEVALAAPGKPIAICHLAADRLAPLHGGEVRPLSSLAGMDVLAVAALAMPGPFFDALRGVGAKVEEDAYPDHHPFSAADALRIVSRAMGRPIVITRKDAVKLRALISPPAAVWVLEQAVRIESGGDVLDEALRRALEAKPK
ncbi:tetraacyldisaccharide 4'-kinase [Longimicrobium sp.]|uniref:tetraacyldisaccharide 4'-kinase n=1 Tax=Longimicrobium sp. TaxID=2029185 RepID=UPI002D189020|nr:tetraacyldisaccharide 4'-kinase [Longimicrobium sp.]HSU14356.1 tetraacyldisaccharide 4'-kinase [Longimicrobium sp.]